MDTPLLDPFGRRVEYLRLSLTDRCDLRCFYCMPKGFSDYETPEHWLTAGEIERVTGAFARLGVRRVRLTGGEPLLRRDLPRIAGSLAGLPGIEDLSLSTNGMRLARLAAPLREAGVTRLNVSLDTLRADRFHDITGGGQLQRVLEGLDAARRAGFEPIKINMVAMRGINLDEVEAMVAFCLDNGFTLRFIETMPVGATGSAAGAHYVDLGEVRERLEHHYRLLPAVMNGGGPARYVQVEGTDLRIGFITPLSQHFCDTCNRVRLGVDGTLYLCLGQDHRVELRPLLRAGADDAELRSAVATAIARKPERHTFNETPGQVVRFMSQTGG